MNVRALPSLLILALLITSCGKDDPVTAKPPTEGQIVFFGSGTDSTTFTHLFVVNADGTGMRQITADSLNDRLPRWSPDGTKIVFVRVYTNTFDSANVSLINADGTGMLRLTNDIGDDTPSWSPDGSQIAYQHDDMFHLTLQIMGSDGTNPQVLMIPDSTNSAREITFTPQGTLLGDDFEGIDLQLSTTATRLTRILSLYPIYGAAPRLSPDGSRIAFSWFGPNASHSPYIYTVRSDGSDMKQLTYGNETSPVWSPDGTKIAYVSSRRIWIMDADGTHPVQVTRRTSSGADYLGDWK